jgi:hypothetical protein
MAGLIGKGTGLLRAALRGWAYERLRGVSAAVVVPVVFAHSTGHFRSALTGLPTAPGGEPTPWYTHPCVAFLWARDFSGRTIVEFGGGNSTLFWAQRAHHVVCVEQDAAWAEYLRGRSPKNVTCILVDVDKDGKSPCARSVEGVRATLGVRPDIVVIDGIGERDWLVGIAAHWIGDDGAIIADDAEGYGIAEQGCALGLQRVDFYGFRAGVASPSCTSLFFGRRCFLFDPSTPVVKPSPRSFFPRSGR